MTHSCDIMDNHIKAPWWNPKSTESRLSSFCLLGGSFVSAVSMPAAWGSYLRLCGDFPPVFWGNADVLYPLVLPFMYHRIDKQISSFRRWLPKKPMRLDKETLPDLEENDCYTAPFSQQRIHQWVFPVKALVLLRTCSCGRALSARLWFLGPWKEQRSALLPWQSCECSYPFYISQGKQTALTDNPHVSAT